MARRLSLTFSLIFCLIISIIFTFTGCGRSDSDGSDRIFTFDLISNPRTLDPQSATAAHERLVIANLFDGLLRMDSNGNITFGVAADYDISACRTVYTFHLRRDVFWYDGREFSAQNTAHDFVFGFRRLFNPAVKSHNSEEYFSILNSRAIREGSLPLEDLGVTAISDFVLEIKLEHPDENLPILLTAPPSFPCNEDFFIHTAGRYGLNESAVASNGGFFLRDWVYDPHWPYENRVILRRHTKNTETERVYPRGIDFRMDRGVPRGIFAAGNSDCIVASGNGADDLIRRNFPYVMTETTVWGLSFNTNRAFSDENLRLALAHAIDRDSVAFDHTGFRLTGLVVPDTIKVGDVFYRDYLRNTGSEVTELQSDSALAQSLFSAAETSVSTPVVIVPASSQNDAIVSLTRSITQQWQEVLSLFCTIIELDVNEYEQRLADGNYDIAVVRISAGYNSPTAILSQFENGSEAEIIQSAELVPLCFMTEYFFHTRRARDLVYNPFTGAIVFRQAKKF